MDLVIRVSIFDQFLWELGQVFCCNPYTDDEIETLERPPEDEIPEDSDPDYN